MKDFAKRKLIVALCLNIVIFVLEIIAVFLSVQRHGLKVFNFYTENSNYFALVVSLIFSIATIISLKQNKILPRWVTILRFTATVSLTITFIVAFFIIVPFRPNLFAYMLYQGSSLYQHLLCPIISLFSFLIFENNNHIPKKSIFYSLIPTIIYGVTFVILNLLKIVTGPYPFFYFYQLPWYISVGSILLIILISTSVAYGIYAIKERKKNSQLDYSLSSNRTKR